MLEDNDFYTKTVKNVFEALKTSDKGLSKEDAQKRFKQYGENQLIVSEKTPRWSTGTESPGIPRWGARREILRRQMGTSMSNILTYWPISEADFYYEAD